MKHRYCIIILLIKQRYIKGLAVRFPLVRRGIPPAAQPPLYQSCYASLQDLTSKSWFHYVERICLRQTHDSSNRELNQAELRLECPTGTFLQQSCSLAVRFPEQKIRFQEILKPYFVVRRGIEPLFPP